MDQVRAGGGGRVILCSNPKAQYLAHKDEIDAAVHRVFDRGSYVLGEEVRAFEHEFAAYCGAAHAIGVNSGTDALIFALRALGIGPGDEVITVSHTAVATVAAIAAAGARPVLVDIDPDSYTIDPMAAERAIGPATKAIVPVHLYGLPADMDAIMRLAAAHELKVVEDCAQATGARHMGRRVGTIGNVGCFSFYPTKNLGAIGDGGAVITNDGHLAERVRRLRQYGWDDARISQEDGLNSRLDEIQAAVLRVKLGHLENDNGRRATIAGAYNTGLAETGLSLPKSFRDRERVYHLYVVAHGARDELAAALRREGVAPGIHYPIPVHRQKAYKDCGFAAEPLSYTERAAAEVLSLPIYPEIMAVECEAVIAALKKAL